jgi:hypothetical protein
MRNLLGALVGNEAVAVAALCAVAVSLKILLLLTSQSAVDGDEAILGLMALHIQRGVSSPLFFYGQSYDAGAGVFAHAAAAAFAIGGVSGLSLKLVALSVWLGMALLAGGVLREWMGWRAAAYGVALILWAPTSVEWAMKARGGYMLSVIFSLMTLAGASRTRDSSPPEPAVEQALETKPLRPSSPGRWRRLASALTIGACGAAAVWAQPTALPLVGVVVLCVVAESLVKRDVASAAVIVAGAIAVSIVPLAVVSASSSSWSWQALADADGHRNPALLFGSVLPALFTPELDAAYPPAPSWVATVGSLWLGAVAGAFVLALLGRLRGVIPCHLRRPSALLLASMASAPLAFFLVDSSYARPRHILSLYPIACILVAGVVELWRRHTARDHSVGVLAVLILSGAAVHVESLGPPTIHGAGEQEWRQPAAFVEQMIADLDRHQVECVFSESPMFQWNLMFASNERIAARWITAQDRWPPYVERVNRAFAAGERCAVLLADMEGSGRIFRLRSRLGEETELLTLFNERYALLYQIPSDIRSVFR